jgi:Ser/Thr protein kinase RdoA (MazF antagonist)
MEDGTCLELVFKDLSPDSLLETARRVRPGFLYDPVREIETYRKLLDPHRFGTPVFHGAVESSGSRQFWLFLERVRGPLLWQLGNIETWCEAARWVAGFQAAFGPSPRPSRHQLAYDRAHLELWIDRARRFLNRKRVGALGGQWPAFKRLADRYDRVVDRLVSMPQGVLHGEFYPSNIILRRERSALRVCPIDWEVTGVGPGLLDLAALTSGGWTEGQKGKMVAAFRESLPPSREWLLTDADLLEGIGFCQLHLAVQWLGWADEWSPPDLHARNWLREALGLAGKLGVI